MKQLLVGRSGRKNLAQATLKYSGLKGLDQKSFGWNSSPKVKAPASKGRSSPPAPAAKE
jgi:hypothetical protein